MNVDLAQIEAGLKTLSGIDFSSAFTAFRTANLLGEISTAEDVASVVADFVPDAMYVRDGLVVLSFIVEAQEAGLMRPAEPGDPAMDRVERSRGGR